MHVDATLEGADLREAEGLARSPLEPLVHLAIHPQALTGGVAFIAGCVATVAGRRDGIPLSTVGAVCGILFVVYLLAEGLMRWYYGWKAGRMNRSAESYDVQAQGIYVNSPGRPLGIIAWSRVHEARVGKRVMILFLEGQRTRLGKRKFFVIPLRSLLPAQRLELFQGLPLILQSKSVQRAIASVR